MDLPNNHQADGATRRIRAQTGFDVRDQAKVAQTLANCRRQRRKAIRWGVISGVLAVVVVVAWTVAGVLGDLHGYQFALGPVLLLLNLVRAIQALSAARKLKLVIEGLEAAQRQTAARDLRLPGQRSGSDPGS